MGDGNPNEYTDGMGDLASNTEARTWADGDSYDAATGARATVYGPIENMVKSFEDGFDFSDFAGASAGLAGQAVGAVMDPLGWLIGNGLDFLLYAVQPLHDLLGMVTGNPTRFAEAVERWTEIRQALEALAQDVDAVPKKWDGEWEDNAQQAAEQRVAELAYAIRGIGTNIVSVQNILQGAAALAQILEEVVKAILSELIKQLIILWIPALAAAGPTFGGSTAAAGAATAGMVPRFLMRGTSAIAEGRTLGAMLKAALSNFNMVTTQGSSVMRNIAETGLNAVPLAGNTTHNTYFNNESIEGGQNFEGDEGNAPETVNASQEEIWEGLS